MSPPPMTSQSLCCPVIESLNVQAVQWECLLPLWRQTGQDGPHRRVQLREKVSVQVFDLLLYYLFNFILVISNCLFSNTWNILSLFCFFWCNMHFYHTVYMFTRPFQCAVNIWQTQWNGNGLHNSAGKEMQVKFVNFFQRSARCTKIYLHLVYCKFKCYHI